MQRDELYLHDIVNAIDSIRTFLQGVSQLEFNENDLFQSAVLHKLTVVGEAAARLTEDLKKRHNEITWKQIISFRNIVVHEYFSVDWRIVWNTATVDIVTLRSQIRRIIEQEFLQEK